MGEKVIKFPILSDKAIKVIESKYDITKEKFLIALGYEDNEEADENYRRYIKYNFVLGTKLDRAIAVIGLNNSYNDNKGDNKVMRKYDVMQEFLDGNFSGCFIVNDKVVYEDYVRELVDKSKRVSFDLNEEELIVDLDGNKMTISYI